MASAKMTEMHSLALSWIAGPVLASATPDRLKARLLRRYLLQQRLRLLQITRVEAFREPAVDRSDNFSGRIRLTSERAFADGVLPGSRRPTLV